MIKDKAQRACFFVKNEEYYRMQFCEEEYFCCLDEESGEDFEFRYDEVIEDEITYFIELTKI